MTEARTIYRMFTGLLYAASVAFLLGTLWWPMGRDQGIFAWAGSEMLRGGVPYLDIWEVKGPIAFYINAASQWMPGPHVWGIRAIDLALFALSALMLRRVISSMADALAADIGVVLYAAIFIRFGFWNTAQPDEWGSMLLIACLWVFVRAEDKAVAGNRDYLAAGALIGLAVFLKTVFVIYYALLAVYIFTDRDRSPRARAAMAGSLIAGGLCIALPVLGWLYHKGALREYLEIQFVFNPEVHRNIGGRPVLSHMGGLLALLLFMKSTAMMGLLGLYDAGRTGSRLSRLMSGMLAAGILFVVVQGRYYHYHAWPLAIAICVYAALGVRWLRAALEGAAKGNKSGAALVLCLCVGFAYAESTIEHAHAISRARAPFWLQRSQKHLAGYEMPAANFSAIAGMEVARHIKENSSAEDTIVVWAVENLIYFQAQRRSATRFGYNYPLVAGQGGGLYEKYRAEFMLGLRKNRPVYIVIKDNDKSTLLGKTSMQYMLEFGEFRGLLEADYEHELKIGNFDLWRLKSSLRP